MKVFNLTDVATKTLERHGLVRQHIAVGTRIVDPGEYVEVEDTAEMRHRLSHLVTMGALSIDSLPPTYSKARGAAEAAAGKAHVGHVSVRETRTAGELPPDPQPAPGARVELAREDLTAADQPAPAPPPEETKPASPEGSSKKRGR